MKNPIKSYKMTHKYQKTSQHFKESFNYSFFQWRPINATDVRNPTTRSRNATATKSSVPEKTRNVNITVKSAADPMLW